MPPRKRDVEHWVGEFLRMMVAGELNVALNWAKKMQRPELVLALRSPLPVPPTSLAKGSSCLGQWVTTIVRGYGYDGKRDFVWGLYDILRQHGGVSFESATAIGALGRTPLQSAASQPDSTILDRLLNDPLIPVAAWNHQGSLRGTPLMFAICYANDHKAKHLVSPTDDEHLNCVDSNGYRALTYAILHHCVETMRALLLRPALEIDGFGPIQSQLGVSVEDATAMFYIKRPKYLPDEWKAMVKRQVVIQEMIATARSVIKLYLDGLYPAITEASALLPEVVDVICGYTHPGYVSKRKSTGATANTGTAGTAGADALATTKPCNPPHPVKDGD